jgi:pimeloyl-ACP methyl ester carboxylesterase
LPTGRQGVVRLLLQRTTQLATHADDAISLIEGLNAARAVVIGYSAEAIIALELALRRPDLLSSIVLLDPAFNLKQSLTPGFLAALAMVKIQHRALHRYTGWLVQLPGV